MDVETELLSYHKEPPFNVSIFSKARIYQVEQQFKTLLRHFSGIWFCFFVKTIIFEQLKQLIYWFVCHQNNVVIRIYTTNLYTEYF